MKTWIYAAPVVKGLSVHYSNCFLSTKWHVNTKICILPAVQNQKGVPAYCTSYCILTLQNSGIMDLGGGGGRRRA